MGQRYFSSRRSFIQMLGWSVGSIFFSSFSYAGKNKRRISFGVCSDAHHDLLPGVKERMQEFIMDMKRQNVDFIIQLGDFCFPRKENEDFLSIWNSFGGPRYHVLGNHDMDIASKSDMMAFLGMPRSYYSFDVGSFHFVVLDLNFIKTNKGFEDFSNANFYTGAEKQCFLPPDQFSWLKRDLEETSKTSIIFSHQSLEQPQGCQNQGAVRALFEEINRRAGFPKVVVCLSGHDHMDYHREINGIHYVRINSISYQWIGNGFVEYSPLKAGKYDKNLVKEKMVPHERALYATVTIKPGQMQIFGVNGYKGLSYSSSLKSDSDLLLESPVKPVISDRFLRW